VRKVGRKFVEGMERILIGSRRTREGVIGLERV